MIARKWQLLNDFKKKKLKAAQEAQEAALRNRILVVGTVVGLLMAIIATVCVTICWVRVRRVADRYEVRHSNLAPTENCTEDLLAQILFALCIRCHRGI